MIHVIRYDAGLRSQLESLAGVDGGTDIDLFMHDITLPDCGRCQNTRRVGSSAFPVACPACSRVKHLK